MDSVLSMDNSCCSNSCCNSAHEDLQMVDEQTVEDLLGACSSPPRTPPRTPCRSPPQQSRFDQLDRPAPRNATWTIDEPVRSAAVQPAAQQEMDDIELMDEILASMPDDPEPAVCPSKFKSVLSPAGCLSSDEDHRALMEELEELETELL